MANYNKVILAGNITRDLQLTYTPSQTAVVDFGMAINRRWKGQDGQQKEETCFVDVRAFGRQAETLNQYMSKGKPILVEGRLDYSQWETQDGQKRSKLRVTVETFQFLGGGEQQSQRQPARQQAPAFNEEPPPTDFSMDDDSVPF